MRSLKWLLLILGLAAGWRAWLLSLDVFPFNSDEAVIALMARHILEGARPVFFYGQAYMGSLDAYLTAFGFLLWGQEVVAIRIIQTLLYLGTIITTVWLGTVIFKSIRSGLLAGLLLVIPTVNVTLYTTVSLGGYGETLLLGNLILLSGYRLLEKQQQPNSSRCRELILLSGYGLLSGFGLWVNGLTLVYSLPVGLAMGAGWVTHARRREYRKILHALLAFAAGFIGGSLPWLGYAIGNGFAGLLHELIGSAVAVEGGSWLMQTAGHFINFALLGIPVLIGLRPPWEVRWLAQPLLALPLVFWMAVFFLWLKQSFAKGEDQMGYRLLLGSAAMFFIAFLFTPFGVDPSGRYFLPLFVLACLAAGQIAGKVIQRNAWRAAFLGLALVYNVCATLECARLNPPGLTTQFYELTAIDHRYDEELIRFLQDNGEDRGYTNYWVAYPLAFLSSETLIFQPRLPYHLDFRYTERDDRYPPYRHIVDESDRVAYITTRHPALDAHLRSELTKAGVGWQEEVIGDYRVFFALSDVIRPQEIGLGITYP